MTTVADLIRHASPGPTMGYVGYRASQRQPTASASITERKNVMYMGLSPSGVYGVFAITGLALFGYALGGLERADWSRSIASTALFVGSLIPALLGMVLIDRRDARRQQEARREGPWFQGADEDGKAADE